MQKLQKYILLMLAVAAAVIVTALLRSCESTEEPQNNTYEVGTVVCISDGQEYIPYSNKLFEGAEDFTRYYPQEVEQGYSLIPVEVNGDIQFVFSTDPGETPKYTLYDEYFERIYRFSDEYIPPALTGTYYLNIQAVWDNGKSIENGYRETGYQFVFKLIISN